MSADADFTARLRAWTYRRQRLAAKAQDALNALKDVVGVYSSHPTAPLALRARCESLDEDQFVALEQERRAVRIPAMRGSIFLVPAETAPVIFSATRVPIESRQANLAYAGLDLATYERLKPRLIEMAREPVDPKELELQVQSGTRLNVVLATMSREGLMLRVGTSLRADRWLYVSTEAWLGAPLEGVDRSKALTWLAGEYLSSFGPARAKDFAWWAGLTQREATPVIQSLDTVDLGDGYLLPAGLISQFESVEPLSKDDVAVLPKWDSYTMAYERSGRGRLIDEEHLASAYTSPASARAGATLGDGLPLLLKEGRAVGTWSHRWQGKQTQIALSPFAGERVDVGGFEFAFEANGRLLGASNVSLSLI